MNRAILLLGHGGPSGPEEIPAYLEDVRSGRPASTDLVQEIRHRYELIGGSPFNRIAAEQATALERELARRNQDAHVHLGMLHATPRIAQALRQMKSAGAAEAVALLLSPHACDFTAARYLERIEQARREESCDLPVTLVRSWWRQPRFLEAQEAKLRAALEPLRRERLRLKLVFTAHALPLRRIAQDEPYPSELIANATVAAGCVGVTDWMLAYQSAGAGAEPWLAPSLSETIPQLAREGYQALLVAPIGFVCDHAEVLYDIDIAARHAAAELGLRLERTECLNVDAQFIGALADAAESALKGPPA